MDRGWTRVELSQKSGISYRTVLDIVAGSARLRDSTIWKLAQVFGVKPSDLETENLVGEIHRPKEDTQAANNGMTLRSAIRAISEQIGIEEALVAKAVADLIAQASQQGNSG